MAILNADHLFEQADKLASSSAVGRPRQVDLRRAISAAYYGLFHFCLAAVADEFVGVTRRTSRRYELVYRSIDHRTFRDVCEEAVKPTPKAAFQPYFPANGLGGDIQAFSFAGIELQRLRHSADYAPLPRFGTADSKEAIKLARDAVRRFDAAPEENRKTFLTLLLCPPKTNR